MDTTGWGILGAGRIAATFAGALAKAPGARLAAVGSRSKAKAEGFASAHGVDRAYGSYGSMLEDRNVDVVYVATPHPFHLAQTIAALQAGKAVLCEKPMAMNEAQVQEMVSCARERGLFLMEGMWTRCQPVVLQVGEWLGQGRIGEVRSLAAQMGFESGSDPADRWLNRELGGGAVLDVGVYTVAFAHYVFGQSPVEIAAMASIGETGVDEQTAMVFRYDDGGLAQLGCAVQTNMGQAARIAGTGGWIDVPLFSRPTDATLFRHGQDPITASGPTGFEFEAIEVMDCLRSGRTESARMPLDESIEIARVLDRVRAAIGLRYAVDKA